MIDIGANLSSPKLLKQVPQLIENARQAGVAAIIATGTSLVASRTVAGLASGWPGQVFATAGVHPHAATEWSAHTELEMRKLLARPGVVAVGECGLDYNRMFSPKAVQQVAFEAQLQLGKTLGRPLFLHCRDAFSDFLAMLTAAGRPPGVVHCFTDDVAEAAAYLNAGYDLGITGWVCDERRGNALRRAVAFAPLDRLHLETDAPYLMPRTAPSGKGRHATNVPANLCWVANEVALLKKVSPETVMGATAANSQRLFGLGSPRSVGG